ncbi:MAG: VWA domain-containing protein, partial [Bifidobacteriaceae bacterium]|nr:VWA domain-containing protein [Bifidobacteriaceae bacterium]
MKRPIHRIRFTALTATITALVVVLGSTGAWFAMGGVETARAGTLDSLQPIGDSGRLVPAPAGPLVEELALSAGQAATISGFDKVPAVEGPMPLSWLVQVTASLPPGAEGGEEPTSPENPENPENPETPEGTEGSEGEEGPAGSEADAAPFSLWLGPDAARAASGELAESSPVLVLDATQPVSTTALVRLSDSGELAVAANSQALVTVRPVAYFTPRAEGEGRPAPSGTEAVAPYLALDPAAELGADQMPTAGSEAWISPAGLGGVPSTAVAGVWLQVVASGTGTIGVGEAGALVPALEVDGLAAGLMPVRLDRTGKVWFAAQGAITDLRVSVVGWTAGADGALDASSFEGGVSLFGPFAADSGYPNLPQTLAPAGSWPLCLAGSTGEGTIKGAGETEIAVAGSATWLLPGGAETAVSGVQPGGATCFGVVNQRDAQTAGSPQVTITAPKSGEVVKLGAEAGAMVTFTGTVQGGAGLQAVTLKRGARFLGNAEVWAGAEGWEWSYTTAVASGKQTITAQAKTWAGEEAEASVTATFEAPPATETVVAPETVVVGEDLISQLVSASGSQLVFASPADLRLGDVLAMAPSDKVPDGRLSKVTGLEQRDGQLVVHTAPGGILDVFQQLDYASLRAPLVAAGAEAEESDPNADRSVRAGDPEAQLVSWSGSGWGAAGLSPAIYHAGGSVVTPLAAGTMAPMYRSSLDVANVELTGKFNAGVDYRNGQRSVSATIGLNGKANGQQLFDSSFNLPTEKVESSADVQADQEASRAEASANVAASLTLKLKTSIDLVIDIKWDWGIFARAARGDLGTFRVSLVQTLDERFTLTATGKFGYGMGSDLASKSAAKKAEQLKDETEFTKRWLLGRATFAVPVIFGIPIPVVVSFYAKAGVNLAVYMEGRVDVSQSFSTYHELGIEFSKGQFRTVDESRNPKKSAAASFKVDVDAIIIPTLELEGMVWDTIGVTGAVSLMAELLAHAEGSATTGDGEATPGPGASVAASASFDAYIFGRIGAKIDLFGERVGRWESAAFELGHWRIWEWSGDACAGSACEDPESGSEVDSDRESAVGRGNRPLVLVVDISGSMAGDRIEEAKQTMAGIVKEQPVGAEIGLYTYPGGPQAADGCYPGLFIIQTGPITGTGDLLEAIDQITTYGDTPTGSALNAVVNQLEADGHTGATILLVSDGESNCGPPPCDEASSIRARGFEITVPTVAFNISDAGREELACISRATDAETYEVSSDDPGQLWDLVEDLSMASLDAEIGVAASAPQDGVQMVDVTLTNPSARDVQAAQFTLRTTVASGEARVVPSANIAVGNIPPGGSVTRTVEVHLSGGTGAVELGLIAWGANVDGVETEAEFAVVDPADMNYEPGELLTDQDGPSVVLGDGFAGIAPEEGQGELADSVLGSAQSGAPGAADLDGVDLAKPGATSRNVIDQSLGSSPPQLGQASGQGTPPKLATVSVGAEDIGLGQLLLYCKDTECPPGSAQLANGIRAAQELDLANTYSQMAQRLKNQAGQSVPVLVTAYPLLFPKDRGRACSAEYSAAEAQAFNSLVGYLNSAIESGVNKARRAGHEVYYVKDTAGALRPDATLCSEQPGVELTED